MIEIADLGPYLDAWRPAALHVAAHLVDGSLFMSRNGVTAPVLPAQLVEAIVTARHAPSIVVLNFCGSIVIARDLAPRMRASVCWPDRATDTQCLELADLLYRGLGRGHTLAASMDSVRITLPGLGIGQNLLPRLVGDGTATLAPEGGRRTRSEVAT